MGCDVCTHEAWHCGAQGRPVYVQLLGGLEMDVERSQAQVGALHARVGALLGQLSRGKQLSLIVALSLVLLLLFFLAFF